METEEGMVTRDRKERKSGRSQAGCSLADGRRDWEVARREHLKFNGDVKLREASWTAETCFRFLKRDLSRASSAAKPPN